MEAYFRLKRIPYTLLPLTHPNLAKEISRHVGCSQMPAVQLNDGRWMTDSTEMIAWFEQHSEQSELTPTNVVVKFFSLILEDYADEWLWRPAMHYRWHYPVGAQFAGAHLAHEVAAGMKAPMTLKRLIITRRQRKGFTSGDGITADQVAGVEKIYHRTLAQLESILEYQPFFLGEQPSLVDVGFAGPFIRHFGLDPVPAEIMRQTAPAVYEWIARLWNYQLSNENAEEATTIPDQWLPLLKEIGESYLPYLNHNLSAVQAGMRQFDATVGGVKYTAARSSHYRIRCLLKLRENFLGLDPQGKREAEAILQQASCWEPLWLASDSELAQFSTLGEKLPFYADTTMLDVY